jgi:hypothetical protein
MTALKYSGSKTRQLSLLKMPETANNLSLKSHLGTGCSFPLRMNLQGNLQLSTAEPGIEESIRIILGTKLGERVYRPSFGSRLSELVFAPMNTQTLLLVRLYVHSSLLLECFYPDW